MSLTIFTAGDPESLRRLAESMGWYAAGVDDVADGWFRTRSESESEWEGTASEAFRSAATRNGRDIVELAEVCANLSRVLHVFADDLDTVRARMRQAEGIAHEAGLLVLNATIHPPHSSAGLPEPSLPGTSPPADPRKEAAYAEAGQTVADARGLEATAHERLLAGLRANSAGLEAIGLHAEWGRAAATAISPAAIGLAGMAMALDEWAAGATRALFEKAVAQDGFAVEAKGELARFQEGLRATHGGEPSHNTVLGHSYGSTVVGYAARDHGMATDEIVFLGSPGVGVEHARELGVPPEHVWSGTSGDDVIDHATPSLDPRDFFDGEDDHWFGMNPSDPHFGARSLETDPNGGHTDYWDRRTSLESMARVVAGVEKGHP